MTRAANRMRGETSLAVGGRCFVLRPSFEALVAAEAEIGSLFALVERASAGELTLAEINTIIWHCMPRGDRPDAAEVGEAIVAIGLLEAIKPVRVLLAEVVKGRA